MPTWSLVLIKVKGYRKHLTVNEDIIERGKNFLLSNISHSMIVMLGLIVIGGLATTLGAVMSMLPELWELS